MAATGYTPIQLYRTATSGAAPSAADLTSGELAINYYTSDMAIYAKNSAGSVIRLMNNPVGLKYPIADGSANQVIKTDGSGNLSFATVGSGTVNSGTSGQLAYYASTGTAISGLTTGTGVATALGIAVNTTAGGFPTIDGTSTLTNKRINPRIISITGSAGGAITPTGDTADQYEVTALGASATFAVPSGTPVDGQILVIRIKDNGTARGLTWTITSGGYRVIGNTLPTTTVISKTIYVGCIYNSADSFWDVVGVASQA